MGFLNGKKFLITGIATNRSIAAGIAKAMRREGAELAFTFIDDRLKNRVERFAEECNSQLLFKCDVTSDEEIKQLFSQLSKEWPKFDGIIHAIAYAPPDQLQKDFVDSLTREGFTVAHEISSYSFAAIAKYARSYLNEKSSLIALTYLGSERSFPNYNVMGLAKASLESNVRYMAMSLGTENIRVNAISAGPVRTLSTSAIPDFGTLLKYFEKTASLKRCVTIEEIGNCAAFLASDLASAITGQIIFVDNGFSSIGIPFNNL